MISASIFLMSYLTAFWYLLFGNNDSSLPNKRNEAAWTATWGWARTRGYHRLRDLESNYNRIPKYPSPNYTGSLSRVPVSRLVSQTRIGQTTKIGRREELETGWPAHWWLRSRQGWPRIEVAPEIGRHVFLHQIFTHFYWVLNPFGIITWHSRSYLGDRLLAR